MCAIAWLPRTLLTKVELDQLEEKMRSRGTCSFKYIENKSSLFHSRFQTNGRESLDQPFYINSCATCFNGQLFDWQRDEREVLALELSSHSFSDIENYSYKDIGSFSMIMSFHEGVFGLRDPYGRRPLYLIENQGLFSLVSEPHILEHHEIENIEELKLGEWVKLNHRGELLSRGSSDSQEKKCLLELAYFMNKKTRVNDSALEDSRRELGRKLARKIKSTSGVVVPIPASANEFARGMSQELALRFGPILKKNQSRTFISKSNREECISKKYRVVGEVPREVILVDDSIISGKTLKHIIELLKSHGTEKISLAIGTPKIKNTCHLGMGFINSRDILFSKDNHFLEDYECTFLDIEDYEEVFQASFCKECLK